MAGDYAGDLTPKEAWDILERESQAALVDVRGAPEWRYVGLPDLGGVNKETVCVSWQLYPDMRPNPDFAEELEAAGVSPEQTLLLLCRSGVRSRDAAISLTARGYDRCYNITGGFEGPHDPERHRGTRDGWKAAGLPWRQE